MSFEDPIQRDGLRPQFWENVPLKNLTPKEWEALCDGCGKCWLNKLDDEDTREVALTRVACRLLDGESCRCAQYDIRLLDARNLRLPAATRRQGALRLASAHLRRSAKRA